MRILCAFAIAGFVSLDAHAEVTKATSCEDIARRAVNEHPRIRASRARVDAALARSRAEGVIPAPRASVEVWDFPIGDPSRADHEGMYMVGLGQEFPAIGSTDPRERAEVENAHAARGGLVQTTRRLWTEAALACADWSGAEFVRERLGFHRTLLLEMREAMLARYRSGGESLSAITRADAELAAADRHVAQAEAEVEAARATLAVLVEGSLPQTPPDLLGVTTQIDLEKIVGNVNRGELDAARALSRRAEAQLEVADAEANAPSFEVRATYMQIPSERAGIGVFFSMSLPWLWGGGDARRESAQYEVAAAAAEVADVDRTVRVEVTRAAGQLRALIRSFELLRDREIPAAQRALESERATLAAGDFNLASWIQAAHALREAHVDEARIRGSLERAWIELESTVGRPIARGEQP